MGIDRIGKKDPPIPPAGGSIGTDRGQKAGHPFEVTSPRASSAPEATAISTPPTPLERLRAGDIDLNGYLDAKVHEATAHLASLPQPELDAIRSALRDRIASDPTLVDLFRTATGHQPDGHEGD